MEFMQQTKFSQNKNLVLESCHRVLVDRLLSQQNFQLLIDGLDSTDLELKVKCINALLEAAKDEINQGILGTEELMQRLVNGLADLQEYPSTESQSLHALHLLNIDDLKSKFLVDAGILDHLKLIINSSSRSKNDNSKYWALNLLHQLSMSNNLQQAMSEKGFIIDLAYFAKEFYGNTTFQKLALHSVVRLLSSVELLKVKDYLVELEKFNFSKAVATALKHDDVEISCWATFLMHEYSIRDLFKDSFTGCRGIFKPLGKLISSNDSCIPRITIRSLKHLAEDNIVFQNSIIKSDILPKIIRALKLDENDHETQYWATIFFHTLLLNESSHAPFIESNGLTEIIKVGKSESPKNVKLYIADIIISLVVNTDTHDTVLDSELDHLIISYISEFDAEVIDAGLALLLNCLPISNDFIMTFINQNGMRILYSLILENGECKTKVTAVKCLLIIGSRIPSMKHQILLSVLLPAKLQMIVCSSMYIKNLLPDSSISPRVAAIDLICSEGSQRPIRLSHFDSQTLIHRRQLYNFLHVISVFLESSVFDSLTLLDGTVRLDSLLDESIREVSIAFLDLASLILLSIDEGEINLDMDLSDSHDKIDSDSISILSLQLISIFCKYEPSLSVFIEEQATLLLHSIFLKKNNLVSDQAIVSFARCIKNGFPVLELLKLPAAFLKQISLRSMSTVSSEVQFFGNYLIHKMVSVMDQNQTDDLIFGTDGIFRGSENALRNLTWRFETVRYNFPVSLTGKYIYEVVVETLGIIQIGWATAESKFDPQRGHGVGDDSFSYSIDGYRAKKWHGSIRTNNTYGAFFKIGDVIGVMIDLDNEIMSYSLNGVALGVAFEKFGKDESWFPAVSLASDQECRISFGRKLDALQFPQLGYLSISKCKYPNDDDSNDALLSMERENNLSPMRAFLSASSGKRTSDERFHLILQLPKNQEEIPQAGIIDFDKSKLVMCAFFPNGKFFIYACEFSDSQSIPWNSINDYLRAADDNMVKDKQEDLSCPPIQITSPSSPSSQPLLMDQIESDLIRLDIVLKDKSWIHFFLNGREIGERSFSGHVNLFPIVRGIQSFKVVIR